MEKGTKLEVTIDLENYTVNIKNIPAMQMFHVGVRNIAGRLLLHGENIPVKEGGITWVKLFDLQPNPDNSLHEGGFVAFVCALNEEGMEVAAEGVSESFFLNEAQIQFIEDTYAANHPKKTPVEPLATSILTVVSETISITTERPAGDAEGETGNEAGGARNIQASPTIAPPPAPDNAHEEGGEKDLTDAALETDTAAANQPPIAPTPSVPTPSPEDVIAFALKQTQMQLKEKEERHTKELERLQAEKDAEIARLQHERTERDQQQAEALRRSNEQAERKLDQERMTHQRVEREQRQRQEQEQVAATERQRVLDEEMATLKRQIAAITNVQQTQTANAAPAPAAPQTTTTTTPPTPQPAPAANPTQTPPTAAELDPEQENDRREPRANVRHARRFVWGTGYSIGLVIFLISCALVGLLLWSDSTPRSEKLADIRNQADGIRLQEETNGTKTKGAATVTPLIPNPVVLKAEEKPLTPKGGDLSLVPSSIRDGAQANISILNNSTFGNNTRIKINNKIDIHDNRQDNRQTIVHPNGWPLDWRPTLPVVIASNLHKGVSTFIIPLRGVQCIEIPLGWCIEPAMQDMAHIDVKYGNDTMCFDYGIGQPGHEISGNYNQIRIRPKGHEIADVTVRVMVTPP